MQLNDTQKKRIENNLLSGAFDMDKEISDIVSEGIQEERARILVFNEINHLKEAYLKKSQKAKDDEDLTSIVPMAVIGVGIIPPIFGITSLLWMAGFVVFAGLVGYWAYKKTPFAGMIGAMCGVIFISLAAGWYMSGRSSIMTIEFVIPIIMAAVPSYLVGMLVSRVFYAKKS